MPGMDQFEGTVTELERSATSEGVTLSFWLVSKTGARAMVELHREEQLKNGDFVAVTGARDSQGTLVASSVRKPAAIRKAPAEPTQWGRVVLSAFISALICTAACTFIVVGVIKSNRPAHSVGDAFGLIVADLIVSAVVFALAYVPLSLVCSLILATFLVSYRRRAHALWSLVVSLPISFVFFAVLSHL